MKEPRDTAEERPFACELCERRFETREQLKDHVWEYHEMDGDITTDVGDDAPSGAEDG